MIDNPLGRVLVDDQSVLGPASLSWSRLEKGGRAVAAQRKDNGDQPPSYVRTAEVTARSPMSAKNSM